MGDVPDSQDFLFTQQTVVDSAMEEEVAFVQQQSPLNVNSTNLSPQVPLSATLIRDSIFRAVKRWIKKRKEEACAVQKRIERKSPQVEKLAQHQINGTFPSDINNQLHPYNQYPQSIGEDGIRQLNEKEAEAITECLRRLLEIRFTGYRRDLESQQAVYRQLTSPEALVCAARVYLLEKLQVADDNLLAEVLSVIPALFQHAMAEQDLM